MKGKIKTLLSFLGILIILIFILFITYLKFTTNINNKKINQNPTSNNLKEITDISSIKSNKFRLENINIGFNDTKESLYLSGILTNLNKDTKKFKIISNFYDNNKIVVCNKTIEYDIKLESQKNVNILINHYYDEIKTSKNNIKYYSIDILEN